MVRFVVRRLFFMVLTFLVISLVTFFLMKAAPGSFLAMNVGVNGATFGADQYQVSPQVMQAIIRHYHLNQPWYFQWWGFVRGFVTLHMGTSFEYPTTPTMTLIRQTFPVSLSLGLISVAVGLSVAIPFGVLAAVRTDTWVDSTAMLAAMTGSAIPAYVIAVFLILLCGVWFHIFPILGYQGPQYYVLPVLSLAIPMVGASSRYLRNSLIENLHSEYVTAIYARGGSLRQAILGNALRNSLLPLITTVGPQLAALMMGTVFIEEMFGLPGMGHIFVNAAGRRDYPLIMDSALLYAVVIMVMNFLVDIVYGVLDPRIRKSGRMG